MLRAGKSRRPGIGRRSGGLWDAADLVGTLKVCPANVEEKLVFVKRVMVIRLPSVSGVLNGPPVFESARHGRCI